MRNSLLRHIVLVHILVYVHIVLACRALMRVACARDVGVAVDDACVVEDEGDVGERAQDDVGGHLMAMMLMVAILMSHCLMSLRAWRRRGHNFHALKMFTLGGMSGLWLRARKTLTSCVKAWPIVGSRDSLALNTSVT